MRVTILFGGMNRERLVSVASAQALHLALPDADLWFWDIGDSVHEVSPEALRSHARPFEVPLSARGEGFGCILEALDRAKAENRLLVLGLHGGMAENGELQLMCELRGIPFTGSASASSHLAFDKIAAKRFASIAGLATPSTIALQDLEPALATYKKLVAKPARDGSSYGLIFINSVRDADAARAAARTEEYLVENCISGVEATCGVLELVDGSLTALPVIEIVPANGTFDYAAKYLASKTEEICPARFATDINALIMHQAILIHKALSCRGYSRSDFIVSSDGPIYIETNTLPGLTPASLYPRALRTHGLPFSDFIRGQIALASTWKPAASSLSCGSHAPYDADQVAYRAAF